MDFKLLSAITGIQVIARGRKIRELKRLQRAHGRGNWRKLKGRALVQLVRSNVVCMAEVHWYEAHGIGKREFKIKHTTR